MKKTFYEFLLYFYKNFIMEDFGDLNKVGKILVYPAWFIRSIIMCVLSPIFIIPFLIQRSKIYKDLKKQSEEVMSEILKNDI